MAPIRRNTRAIVSTSYLVMLTAAVYKRGDSGRLDESEETNSTEGNEGNEARLHVDFGFSDSSLSSVKRTLIAASVMHIEPITNHQS